MQKTSSPYAIDVKGLCKSFDGKKAVINVSLRVKRGEIFGFLGPNGSGKTTTIRMLCGLMTPDEGSGTCLGYDILRNSRMIKRHVGYVPQTFSLYQDLTVKENLAFIASLYEIKNENEAVLNIINELGLQAYKNILAGRLSGGWKQRLSLASALIHEPQLLLLDEPTAGVDPKARREFWDEITHLKERGITSLVSTHYMDEALRCNQLAYIVYGHLMIEGTISEIIAHTNLYTFATKEGNLQFLRKELTSFDGIEQATILGNELRIVGKDQTLLEKAIQHFPDSHWYPEKTSLESVFIHLVEEEAK